MRITRRGFVIGALVAAAGVAILGVRWAASRLNRLGRLASVPAAAQPLAPGQPASAVVEATVQALLGPEVDVERYLDVVRWRATNLDGLGTTYTEFAEWADAEARRRLGRAFAACTPDERRALVAGPPGRRVVQEILMLYALTDAWVAVGYDGWPGLPRGLEAYARKPG